MILTGILIENYGIEGTNPMLTEYFGWGMISMGSLNLVIDYFKKPKNK